MGTGYFEIEVSIILNNSSKIKKRMAVGSDKRVKINILETALIYKPSYRTFTTLN